MKYYINEEFLIPEENMFYQNKEQIADFKLIDIKENADFSNIDLTDFDIAGGEFIFDFPRHFERVTLLKFNYENAIYKNNIAIEIKKRYSVEDEIAILRQKENNPNEYAEYFSYVEECKQKFNKNNCKKN